MFWRNKSSSHKKDDSSSSLLPGNAEAQSEHSNSYNNQREGGGLLNRAVRRITTNNSNNKSSVLPTHSSSNSTLNSTSRSKASLSSSASSTSSLSSPYHHKPYRKYPGRSAPGSSPCNNFLLGGQYYPGKDKRRRISRHRPSSNRQNLLYRVFCSSPWRMILSFMLLVYIFKRYISNLPMSVSKYLFIQIPRNENEDKMPMKESKLVKEILDDVGTMKSKLFKYNPSLISKEGSTLSDAKTNAIRQIDKEWANRFLNIETEEKSSTMIKKDKEKNKVKKSNDMNKVEVIQQPNLKVIQTHNWDTFDKSTRRTLQTWDDSGTCSMVATKERSVTLVLQSTPNRLFIMHETCQKWTDPIILVVYNDTISHADFSNWETDYDWVTDCSHITIISVSPPTTNQIDLSHYPVNQLRNVGLDAIKTTHFLVMDVDFIPSSTLLSNIHDHIDHVKDLEALVVPAFQKDRSDNNDKFPCSNAIECASFFQENPNFLPSTFEELISCTKEEAQIHGRCSVFQSHDNIEGHSTTQSERWLRQEWFEDESNSKIPLSIPCFDSFRYEPYVVLPWCPNHTPYYDERFYGYGKNKIQYVSHLRFLNYSFRILPEGFIVHFPHDDSASKKIWNNVDEHDLHWDMDRLYPEFLKELKERYGHPNLLSCNKKH